MTTLGKSLKDKVTTLCHMMSILSLLPWLPHNTNGQFPVRFMSSLSSLNTNQRFECSHASRMILRTVSFRNAGPYNESCKTGLWSSSTGSGLCSNQELLNLYRKYFNDDVCCDTASLGDFTISYICLDDPIFDPCSDFVWTGELMSLFVNYSQHAKSEDVKCQCKVMSPKNTTVSIIVTHLYEVTKSGPSNGRFPHVWVNSGWRKWEVGQRALPVVWQIREEDEDWTVLLQLDDVDSASFGRTWLGILGNNFTLSCNSTSQPRNSQPRNSTSYTTSQSRLSPASVYWSLTHTIAASCAASVLFVSVTFILMLKYQRRSVRKAGGHLSRRGKESKPEVNVYCIVGDEEFCPLNSLPRSEPLCTIQTTGASQPSQPASNDACQTTTESNDAINAVVESRDASKAGDSIYAEVARKSQSVSDHSKMHSCAMTKNNGLQHQEQARMNTANETEYSTLYREHSTDQTAAALGTVDQNAVPSNMAVGNEGLIYNHIVTQSIGLRQTGENLYNELKQDKSYPVVIDNVYDSVK